MLWKSQLFKTPFSLTAKIVTVRCVDGSMLGCVTWRCPWPPPADLSWTLSPIRPSSIATGDCRPRGPCPNSPKRSTQESKTSDSTWISRANGEAKLWMRCSKEIYWVVFSRFRDNFSCSVCCFVQKCSHGERLPGMTQMRGKRRNDTTWLCTVSAPAQRCW